MQLIFNQDAQPHSLLSHDLASPDHRVPAVKQEAEDAMAAWIKGLITREQGQRLKRDPIAQAVHDAVEGTRNAVPSRIELAAVHVTAEPEPARTRWQSWLRRLSPRHRAIDQVRSVAHSLGRDFDEAQAERFLALMNNQPSTRSTTP